MEHERANFETWNTRPVASILKNIFIDSLHFETTIVLVCSASELRIRYLWVLVARMEYELFKSQTASGVICAPFFLWSRLSNLLSHFIASIFCVIAPFQVSPFVLVLRCPSAGFPGYNPLFRYYPRRLRCWFLYCVPFFCLESSCVSDWWYSDSLFFVSNRDVFLTGGTPAVSF